MRCWAGGTLNAILSLQSGMPVTVTQATNNNSFAGFALQRPFVQGKTSLPASARKPTKFFNTDAFLTAPRFVLGNASRNPVRGPAYRDLDLALVKHFSLTGEGAGGVSRGAVRRDEYAGVFAAEWELRIAGVRDDHEHDDRSAGGAVCSANFALIDYPTQYEATESNSRSLHCAGLAARDGSGRDDDAS